MFCSIDAPLAVLFRRSGWCRPAAPRRDDERAAVVRAIGREFAAQAALLAQDRRCQPVGESCIRLMLPLTLEFVVRCLALACGMLALSLALCWPSSSVLSFTAFVTSTDDRQELGAAQGARDRVGTGTPLLFLPSVGPRRLRLPATARCLCCDMSSSVVVHQLFEYILLTCSRRFPQTFLLEGGLQHVYNTLMELDLKQAFADTLPTEVSRRVWTWFRCS
jgi:hypothetical protein